MNSYIPTLPTDNKFYDVSNSWDTNTDGDSQTLLEYGDNNGLLFAPMCNLANDNDVKCFDTRREKKCDHKIDKVALNKLGQYVIFPSRWWHRGFYEIRLEKEYYIAHFFAPLPKIHRVGRLSFAGKT